MRYVLIFFLFFTVITSYCQVKKETKVRYGRLCIGAECSTYDKLSERGKDIVDSLKDKMVGYLPNSQMAIEAHYMNPGKMVRKFWDVFNGVVYIYYYSVWNNKIGSGFELKKRIAIN